MTTENNQSDSPPPDEDWEEIENPVVIPEPTGSVEVEPHAFRQRPATRPWIISRNTATLAFILAILILAFPEFRDFRITNNLVLNTGYILMPLPIIAFIWGAICLLHSEHRKMWRPATTAIIIACISAALFVYTASTNLAVPSVPDINQDSDRSVDMTQEELKAWREKKLNR